MSLLSKNKNINPPESIDIVNLSDIRNDFGGSLRRYLEDNEIIALYLNCHALVMPTFVGHYSLPLFESFYFKIPAFFTKDLLDDNLRKFAFEIDTKSLQRLLGAVVT